MTRLLRRHGVKQTCTTPYNPKGNGTTERLNRTLMSLLRGAISPEIEWDTLIPVVLDIYNHCPHSSIGMSPYEAITGRPSRHIQLMPDTRATLLASSGKVTPSEVLPHSTTTRLNLRHRTNAQFAEAWSEAEADWLQKLSYQLGQLRDAHMHTQHQRHQLVNKHATAPVYQVGDMVVLRDIHRPPGVEGKLRRPYLGPWQIIDVHANHTLSLSDLDGNMLPRRIPSDHVRSWKTSST